MSRKVGTADAKGKLDCRLGLPDYVDCKRLLRMAVMMSVSSWAPLVVYFAGHFVGHCAESPAGLLAEHCVVRSAGHSAGDLVEISGAAFAVVAAIEE